MKETEGHNAFRRMKEMVDLEKTKAVLFEHCAEAADRAIGDPTDPHRRHEGGNRQAAAAYSALLAVITAAGLDEEYREWRN